MAEATKTLSSFLVKCVVTARRLVLFEGISAAAVTAISFGPTLHWHSSGIWVWTASVGGPLGADDSDSESRDLIFYFVGSWCC